MKAWILRHPAPVEDRPLTLEDVGEPVARPGEVLLQIRACGVCRTDLHVVEGELERRLSPVVPGHQVVAEVIGLGPGVDGVKTGDRVGVAWLNETCGTCRFCESQRENLCEGAEFTGWSRNGGYAERMTAPVDFVYPLPRGLSDVEVAPLLCAGVIGYRCLRRSGIFRWEGARLGIYGFGAAGHLAIQIARARGADVYVMTRDRVRHRPLAEELGAAWVGDTYDAPPVKLDAAIVFAPVGRIVPTALAALDKGGTLVLGGIHMSQTPSIDYRLLYDERVIRSVANNTREDGRDFLAEAAQANVRTSTELFPLEQADEALIALKRDGVRGAAVLTVRS